MIKVYLSGEHSKRSPLAYPALVPLFETEITFVRQPREADLCVFAHILDIQNATSDLIDEWRQRQLPIVLLSEEPFWDTIWGQKPLDPLIYIDTAFGTVPVHQINHSTSDVFRFGKIPYYLLTNPRFVKAYRDMFKRNAARSHSDWRDLIAGYDWDLTFMFERRPEPFHSVAWPDGDIIGLCSWRTELAEACQTGRVARLGRSWQGGESRFELQGDWHADKLKRLDGTSAMIGAIENTHQPNYITEKFFDAFACGGFPLYVASPSHRINEFGLPQDSWINLYGLTPQEAANHIYSLTFLDRITALQDANAALLNLFSSAQVEDYEQSWFADRLIKGLLALTAA